ncbi:LuxR C-terminal-related transcriptional regulator [Aquihabitans sp. G128]|uniref:helix-turn-helix transcriptional regulator n=1 Tax=Aquihabitans sp. G128 TaxID=2849779 RepID=UPI001C2258B4|nr:LuxR C-terminal-related transcriptional regulator [Aquihabitans sp. G128]QXC59380.1 LuxR C-terminal-related transcriptional regulator [Aquihabitans sp. G128]
MTRTHRISVQERSGLFGQALLQAVQADPRYEACEADGGADVVVVCSNTFGSGLEDALAQARSCAPGARVLAVVGDLDHALADLLLATGADVVVCATVPLPTFLDALEPGAAERHLPETAHDDRASAAAREAGLTPRQYEVLQLLGAGVPAQQISRQLQIAVATTRDHIKALHRAFDCNSSLQLVIVAARRGLLPALQRPTA